MIESIDRRDAHTRDGALSPAAWLRSRTRQAPSEVTALMNVAVRLRRFPHLREALESGAITMGHVTEVSAAAVPRRAEVIAAFDEKLSEVARHGTPADVRAVVARIRDAHDDAGDVEPLEETGPDERRDLAVFDGIDGLVEVRGTLDGLDGEALRTALDAYERPDPADTPPEQRRSSGQRRADALCAILATALHVAAGDGEGEPDGDSDGHERDSGSRARPRGAKSIDGYPAQILVVVDLLSLIGLDTLAEQAAVSEAQVAAIASLAGVGVETARRIAAAAVTRSANGTSGTDGGGAVRDGPLLGQPIRSPRARYSGSTSPRVVRRLAQTAKVQALVTLGPWRAVSVGRVHRTLPAWLRGALTAMHGHCRGPDCDRPVSWCDAHHTVPWDDGGDTDLNATIPGCRPHHQTLTLGVWNAILDCDTGDCTWTGPDDQTIVTRPPPL